MSRTEVFEGSGPAPGSWMRVKMGANSAGKITAAEIELAFEARRVSRFPGDAGRDLRLRLLRTG